MSKTFKTTRDIVMITAAMVMMVVAVLMAAGCTFKSVEGALIISMGSLAVSIPVLGYIATLPGLCILGAFLISLMVTYIPQKKTSDVPEADAKEFVNSLVNMDAVKNEYLEKAESLEAEKNELLNKITGLEASLSKKTNEIDTLNNANAELEMTISQLEAAVEQKDDGIDKASELLAQKDSQIITLNGEMAEIKEMADKTETKNKSLTDRLDAMTKEANEQKKLAKDRQDKILEMESSMQDRKEYIEKVEDDKANLELKLEELIKESVDLKDTVAVDETKIAELEKSLQDALDSDKENNSARIKAESEIADLKSVVDTMTEDSKLLYARYVAVIEFLLQNKMTNKDAFQREKERFASFA